MLVYDIAEPKNAANFGILLNIDDEYLSVSTYTFKEEPLVVFGDYELSENNPIMEQIYVHHHQVITLEQLRSLPEWEDYTLWSFLIRDSFRFLLTGPLNRNAYTIGSKFNRRSFLNIWGNIILELVVPHKGIQTFDEMGISVVTGSDYPLITNIHPEKQDPSWVDDPDLGMQSKLRHVLLPTIDIIGPDTMAANSTEEFVVRTFQNNEPFTRPITVRLESTGGYLPLRRLDDVVIESPFMLTAEGLKPGQKIIIKAGVKYWSSLGIKEIVVI